METGSDRRRTGERNRCVTGIDALDNALGGGIPRGNTVLITGSCGTGKTSLSMEFLIHGAVDGETGLFVSVTEPASKLLQNMIPYEFFDPSIIDKSKLILIDMSALYERLGLQKAEFSFEEIEILVTALGDLVKDMGVRRLVVDSITSVCFQLKTEEKIRSFLIKLGKTLNDLGCTSILVSEILPSEARYSTYGVEEAIADGIVLMGNLERKGDLLRTLQVVKMRGTGHSRAKYVLDLTSCGVLLVPLLKGGGA